MPRGRLRIRDNTDNEWRYVGAHEGPEWVRITLPTATTGFSTRIINIATQPTKTSDAPTELTTHTGSGSNVRIRLGWNPPATMQGWVFVPLIGTSMSEMPGRVHYPLHFYSPLNIAAISYSDQDPSAIAMLRACAVQWRLDEVEKDYRLDVVRFNNTVGLPANAFISIRPWYGG